MALNHYRDFVSVATVDVHFVDADGKAGFVTVTLPLDDIIKYEAIKQARKRNELAWPARQTDVHIVSIGR